MRLRTCSRGHVIDSKLRACPACTPRGRDARSPSTRAQRDGTGDYERNRARLLAGGPVCALRVACDGAPATTADHILPVAAGGGHEPANLQPSCGPCNASKGSRTSTASVVLPRWT